MADGGEGTVDAFETAVPGARRMPVRVTGPEGLPVDAAWLLLPPTDAAPGGTGVVELASTSGIELLGSPPRLRPLDAHTRGFGEAIAAALAQGVDRLVLGIGSSASTDGGVGLLTALGARFTDAAGDPIAEGGRGLADLMAVDVSRPGAAPARRCDGAERRDESAPRSTGSGRRVRPAEGRRPGPGRSARRGPRTACGAVRRRPEDPGRRCGRRQRVRSARVGRAARAGLGGGGGPDRTPRGGGRGIRRRDGRGVVRRPVRRGQGARPRGRDRRRIGARPSRSWREGSRRRPTCPRSQGRRRSPSSPVRREAAMADPARWLVEAGAELARALG